MSRQRLCRVCGRWHEVDEPWPEACAGHFRKRTAADGPEIIKDIEPYRSIIDGRLIGSRSTHREHLREHGCIEVGNEKVKPRAKEPPPGIGRDIKRAIDELRSK